MKKQLTSGAIALAMAMFMIVAGGAAMTTTTGGTDMGSGAMLRVIHASPTPRPSTSMRKA